LRTPKLRKNGDGRAFAVTPNSRGQRTYFGKFGTTEAEAKYREWLTALYQPVLNQPDGIVYRTVKLSVAKYLETVRDRVSDTEYGGIYQTTMRLVSSFGHRYIADVPVVENVIRRMLSETYNRGRGTPDRPYARSYVNKSLARIKRFFRWCHRYGYVSAETYSRINVIDPIRRGEHRREPVGIHSLTDRCQVVGVS
jgi:hypothetical protein